MAIRNDVVVDFSVSPRIVEVASPSVAITIQDLHDTLRYIEARIWNTSYPKLLSSAGKENLGGGLQVGITATLQDAKLSFQARSGPSFVQCNVRGGNLVAVDANSNELEPILTTNFTQVVKTASTSAALLAEWTQTEKDTHISTTQNIPVNVWDSVTIIGRTTIGSIGKRLVDVLKLKRTKP